jgi:hypothetical protein
MGSKVLAGRSEMGLREGPQRKTRSPERRKPYWVLKPGRRADRDEDLEQRARPRGGTQVRVSIIREHRPGGTPKFFRTTTCAGWPVRVYLSGR